MQLVIFIKRLVIIFLVSNSHLIASEALPKTGMIKLPVLAEQENLRVWYQLPEQLTPETAIVFVMHGVNRNADEYRDAWVELAKQNNFIVLVPEFTKQQFPRARSYNLGNMYNKDNQLNMEDDWSFSVIERVFTQFKQQVNNNTERFYIFGHSAGAQFVHRLLLFKPTLAVELAIAANAGWYTLPSYNHTFPYGLQESGIDEVDISTYLSAPLFLLLGDKDNDPNDKHLRRAAEANRQGAHRFARGNYYYRFAKYKAAELKVPFNWQREVVKNVGHDNSLMAPAAARIIKHHINKKPAK